MTRLRTACIRAERLQVVWGALCALCCLPPLAAAATVTHKPWGNDPAGKPVELYTLTTGKASVSIATYGARIVSIEVPDRTGTLGNVVITKPTADQYAGPYAVTGATVGRYAGRIAGGALPLEGSSYALPTNNGGNTLHGGPDNFPRRNWTAEAIKDGVVLSLVSPDGDQGFPGELTLHVSFVLTKQKGSVALRIHYSATATKTTVLNLTNHTYFNLSNNPDTPVLQDTARIAADSTLAVGTAGIPTGTLTPVAGTPLDFRQPRTLAVGLPDRGYDNTFVLRSQDLKALAAEVDDPLTGRSVRVYTTEPGLQLFVPYTSPTAVNTAPPGAPPRPRTQAFCLETQHYPDSPHHPGFPSTVLQPGKTFTSDTVYVFGLTMK